MKNEEGRGGKFIDDFSVYCKIDLTIFHCCEE